MLVGKGVMNSETGYFFAPFLDERSSRARRGYCQLPINRMVLQAADGKHGSLRLWNGGPSSLKRNMMPVNHT